MICRPIPRDVKFLTTFFSFSVPVPFPFPLPFSSCTRCTSMHIPNFLPGPVHPLPLILPLPVGPNGQTGLAIITITSGTKWTDRLSNQESWYQPLSSIVSTCSHWTPINCMKHADRTASIHSLFLNIINGKQNHECGAISWLQYQVGTYKNMLQIWFTSYHAVHWSFHQQLDQMDWDRQSHQVHELIQVIFCIHMTLYSQLLFLSLFHDIPQHDDITLTRATAYGRPRGLLLIVMGVYGAQLPPGYITGCYVT